MEEKLRNDILYILNYFYDGLSDVQAGSGEQQPMLNEIKSVLEILNGKPASPPSMPGLTDGEIDGIIRKTFPFIENPDWLKCYTIGELVRNRMRSQCDGLIKQKAVEFVEWMHNNNWVTIKIDDTVVLENTFNSEGRKIEQVYEIFNQQER